MKAIYRLKSTLLASMLASAMVMLPQASRAEQSSGVSAQTQDTNAQARLNKKQFSNVKVSVQNGIATLTGTVDLYEYKMDAAKRVTHAQGVTAVRNEIQVGGPSLSDAALEKKLGQQLAYSREGYGNVFDAITLKVENGVVTLGGHSHDYPDRDAALALAATTPGVKQVVDNIGVDPVSPMDWQIRIAVARAIYGFPTLNKYAIDPVRPIRISVQNGHVELYGTVDSQSDKNVAYMRADGVPGVFSVKNYIQVAGQSTAPGE
ncbi:MAG TPA: BON domain-containing protein [Terracidiphilus sp.]